MALLSPRRSAWLRRNLSWSNSPRSWAERLGVLAVILGATCLVYCAGQLPAPLVVALGAVLAAVLLVALRRGGLRLFGPVLFYEIVRIARRSRYAFLRCAYALILFAVLFSVYRNYDTPQWRGTNRAQSLAEFADAFFTTFMTVQFLAVAILTPAYAAGAVAEERDRRTLEYLLATDLHNREIVLGKLASRLGNLALLVLTGLPFLSFLQFLGGVDPGLVLAGYAALGLTMASLTSVKIGRAHV